MTIPPVGTIVLYHEDFTDFRAFIHEIHADATVDLAVWMHREWVFKFHVRHGLGLAQWSWIRRKE
jgi:hypothetical protein